MVSIVGSMTLGLALTAVAGAALAQGAPSGDPVRGEMLYSDVGCYECHNYAANGGAAGPKIAPPMAYEPFLLQLRQPRLVMIPYSEEVLSDAQAADIYAYLASLPAPQSADSIPLLQTMP